MCSSDLVTQKAAGYGVAHDRFFADDVIEVEERIAAAVKRAREESLPSLIEIRTYRFRGHSMSDPGKYRTSDELEMHKKKDPILRARARLIDGGYDEAKVASLEAGVETEVQAAVKFADESPEPDLSVLEPTTYDGPFAG